MPVRVTTGAGARWPATTHNAGNDYLPAHGSSPLRVSIRPLAAFDHFVVNDCYSLTLHVKRCRNQGSLSDQV